MTPMAAIEAQILEVLPQKFSPAIWMGPSVQIIISLQLVPFNLTIANIRDLQAPFGVSLSEGAILANYKPSDS
jgi:hypothetical protein